MIKIKSTQKFNLKNLLILSLILGFNSVSFSQKLEEYIPSEAMVVLSLNSQSISEKADIPHLLELDIFSFLDAQIKRSQPENQELIINLYKNPNESGITFQPSSFGYLQFLDSMISTAYLIKIKDGNKFQKFAQEVILPQTGQREIETKGNYSIITNGPFGIGWNSDHAIIMVVEESNSKPNYLYYEESDEAYEARIEQQEIMKARLLRSEIESHFSGNKKKNITQNANFSLHQQNNSDIGLWVNFEGFSRQLSSAFNSLEGSPMAMDPEALKDWANGWLENNYYHINMYFENGQIRLAQKQFLSDKLFNITKDIYKEGVNPKFVKYINGKNLLGFMALSIDQKALFNAIIEMYMPIIEAAPQYGKYATTGKDLLGIILDEDAITEIFKGDILFAVTDLKEVEITYTDYEYDDNFNLNETQKTKKETQPIFTALATIGNKENFNKIIKGLENFEIARYNSKGKYYDLIIPKAPINPYLAIIDDMVLVTNDASLVSKRLKKGIKKKDLMDKSLQPLITENSISMFMNLGNIIEVVKEEGKDNMKPKDLETMDQLSTTLDNWEFKGVKVGDKSFESEFISNFKDKNKNSFTAFLEMLNSVYLSASGN
ncbi:DUF4836 family protein [Flexithrix dorotheae]|uniref:DUF4836 family protein n=1 Tax=Flexithrix dorotheae TaxID=70993 RepID=UPI0003773B5A|nr:DUF4836 family protein [Flexithrix dorotheae]